MGLESVDPLVEIDTSRAGIDMDAGLAHYQLGGINPPVDLVHVRSGDFDYGCNPRYEFWAVPQVDYDRLFHHVRRRNRRATRQSAPIMTEDVRTRLWDHTIGFLKRSVHVLRKYGVAQRRGILLTGQPGNGKTMAARWLRHECRRHQLSWRTISADEYQSATEERALRDLFHLRRPGIVQFDDLDQHLRDRNQVGTTGGHTVLLTELDGVEPKRGVVYLFTSNARLDQLDPAIRRPGRIDQVIQFPHPNGELRRRLVQETWHADLVTQLNLEQVVRVTEGLSFAEMEEVKKLLVLRFLDTAQWDWQAAWEAFCGSRQRAEVRPIGFQFGAGCRAHTQPTLVAWR